MVYEEDKNKLCVARMVVSLRYYVDCRVFAMVGRILSRCIAVLDL